MTTHPSYNMFDIIHSAVQCSQRTLPLSVLSQLIEGEVK